MEAKKLLKKLFTIHSPSDEESEMREFIIDWVKSNVPSAEWVCDQTGNLYVTKGMTDKYPCIVAHMDQVQEIHSKDFRVIENDEIMFGYSPSNKQMEGLGADDKVGIWIALCCLKSEENLKCVFFVGEEVGCVGSSRCDMAFFNDCMYVLQCDRKGRNDFITNAGYVELCSDEFVQDAGLDLFGYEEEHGLMTDVMTLKENGLKVSAANMSCGYYEPHTSHEFIVISDVVWCLEFVRNILRNCTRTYPHEAEVDIYGYGRYGGYPYGGFYGRELHGTSGGYNYHKQTGSKKHNAKISAKKKKEQEDLMYEINSEVDYMVCNCPEMSDDDICYEILAMYPQLVHLTSAEVYALIAQSRATNYMDDNAETGD